MTLIAAASKMPIIVLRELIDETLVCLAKYGLDERDPEELHLSPIGDFPAYERAVIHEQVVVIDDMEGDEARHVLQTLKLEDRNVRSICIVPVLVGSAIWGTLSFAVQCDHDYTRLERNGLKAVANAVGVAFSNYHNLRQANERHFENAKIDAAITTMDVAQAVRHEGLTLLDGVNTKLARWLVSLSKPIRGKDQASFRQDLERLSEDYLQRLRMALEKLRTASKPPAKEFKLMSLKAIWDDAFDLVSGRLSKENIQYHVKGDAEVRVAPEYLRSAFLNVISNSIDAFKDGKKSNRRIDVSIASEERANFIACRYADTGPGIDPSRLRPCPRASMSCRPMPSSRRASRPRSRARATACSWSARPSPTTRGRST